ncbi:hypothetical protein [Planococcus sp. ISL-109]|uniref:hypothetical protein n=1 Tax=Planococcus sp. ISL-109 TaxID=2819166 RepID=UPI001BEA20FB|nr:hypothetical protein [Planococcus sp. ISL-109]MBT2583078.1 hypothetical protein [Planococcus sp. ISL-109]
MKPFALILWFVGVLILGFSGLSHWQFIVGLFLFPIFFIGKPWHSHLKKPAKHIEQK